MRAASIPRVIVEEYDNKDHLHLSLSYLNALYGRGNVVSITYDQNCQSWERGRTIGGVVTVQLQYGMASYEWRVVPSKENYTLHFRKHRKLCNYPAKLQPIAN